VIRLGIFYRNASRPVYEEIRHTAQRTVTEKFTRLEQELDRYAV
jgi:hypothetical protein